MPITNLNWHSGARDHTVNGNDGYMYLLNVGAKNSVIFESTIKNLSAGVRYEFSAYLANVENKNSKNSNPNLRFEVRTLGGLLERQDTNGIPKCKNMNWQKYGLSFIAPTNSVTLSMISNVGDERGNNIAIDDIEVRACSNITSTSNFLG